MTDFVPPGGEPEPPPPPAGSPPPPPTWLPPPAPANLPPAYGPRRPTPPFPPSARAPAPPWSRPQQLRPLRGLAIGVQVVVAVAGVVAAAAIAALAHRVDVVDGILTGEVTVDEVDAADAGVAATTGLFVLTLVAGAVLFIVWQWRHAKNAEVLGPRLGLGPGWAVGGWFVPVGNWVLPGLQLAQAARSSHPQRSPDQPRAGRAPAVILLWAVLYGLAGIVFVVGVGLSPDEEDPRSAVLDPQEIVDEFTVADRVASVGYVLYVAAAVAAIAMVRTLSRRQEQAIAAFSGVGGMESRGPAAPPEQPGSGSRPEAVRPRRLGRARPTTPDRHGRARPAR